MNQVVLVDDEPYVRKGLRSLIDWKSCGFEVCDEADNGEDALQIINNINPELVITDIRMPILDGLELIKSIVEMNKVSSKFIIISGFNDFKYAQQALRYGVSDFILKPIDKEELEATLKKLAETLETEKQEIKKREQLQFQQIIEDLLSGDSKNDTENNCKLILRANNCLVYYFLLFEVNGVLDNNKLTKLLWQDKIKSTIQYVVKTSAPIYLHENSEGIFGSIINSNDLKPYQDRIDLFINKLHIELANKIGDVSIYIGSSTKELTGIKDSFQTAKIAMDFKYTQPKNLPIYYEQIKDLKINYTEIENSLFNTLMEHIEENNPDEIRSTISTIFNEFSIKSFAPEAVKTSINRCVHGVIGRIKNLNGNEMEILPFKTMIDWQHYRLTTGELKSRLTDFMLVCSEIIIKLRKEHSKGDITQIRHYIERNFHLNLSLKSIASKFFMNPVYMGQLFKKTYGIYFKDFLLDIRLNEAKNLLRQTNLRVYEIAEKVGFGSTDYFVTQFEKIEGVTPTEYRNQIFNS